MENNKAHVPTRLEYNRSMHNFGRLTVVGCLALFLMPAFGLAIIYDIPIDFKLFLATATPLLLTYGPSAICENLSYAPIIGAGGLYVACITGNLGSMKIPAALNAIDLIDEQPGTEKADIASVLAIAASSFVCVILIFAGVLFLAPIMEPIVNAPFLQPAFNNLIPALTGAVVAGTVMRNKKESILPFLLPIIIIFIIGRSAYSSNQGYMMPVVILISMAYSYLLNKNKLKK